MKFSWPLLIRATVILMIVFSILATFVSKVLMKDYEVVTNEDGLPLLDE